MHRSGSGLQASLQAALVLAVRPPCQQHDMLPECAVMGEHGPSARYQNSLASFCTP